MRTSYLAFILTFSLSAFLILAGCSKVKIHPPEGSTAVHEHGLIKKDVQEPATKRQTTCPVMGAEIDREIYAEYAGKRVYFCCQNCLAEFKKNPQKYVKILEDKGVVLEKVPTM